MGAEGFEPSTSAMWTQRSNRLSHAPGSTDSADCLEKICASRFAQITIKNTLVFYLHNLWFCGSDRSISRVQLPPNAWRLVTIYLGLRLPAASSNQPETKAGHFICLLFGLAPGGVYHACNVTITAVVSYTTVSPLPATNYSGLSILCGTFLPERGKK